MAEGTSSDYISFSIFDASHLIGLWKGFCPVPRTSKSTLLQSNNEFPFVKSLVSG